MRILITNDDGVHAEGLFRLHQALREVAKVTVVAPERPRSACGHSITLHKPLRLNEVRLADGSPAWACSGTPADCVTLGVLDVLAENPPDILFSGINNGPNLGWDLSYSGTVAGALEGAMLGVPSVAISVAWRFRIVGAEEDADVPPLDFRFAAEFARTLVDQLVEDPLPPHTLLNVNVPFREPRGVQATHQGVRRYPAKLESRRDPRGQRYFWIGGDDPVDVHEPGSDVNAIHEGCISVTPVQLYMTDQPLLERLRRRYSG